MRKEAEAATASGATNSGLYPIGTLPTAANNMSVQADAAAASMGAPAALTGQSRQSPAGAPNVSVPGTVNPNRIQSYLDAASKSEQSRPSAPPAANFGAPDTSTGTSVLNQEVVTVKGTGRASSTSTRSCFSISSPTTE